MRTDIGNIWYEKSVSSKTEEGPERVALLYCVGLLACVVSGFLAPDLFISKSGTFAEGSTTAGRNYLFGISDYKRLHQNIFLGMRLNVPAQLEDAMEANDQTIYGDEGRYTISVYGSEQSTVASDDCPAGCVSCPDGGEGFACDLLSNGDNDSTGTGTVTCHSGGDWCSWQSLYSLDFVEHKTYYLAIETEYGMDDYIASAEIDPSEDWVSEFLVVFVSPWYTRFEMAWFYGWTFITVLVMFFPRRGFFAVAISDRVLWSKWNGVQKWVSVLLSGLFLFNNPLFASQIYSSSPKAMFVWYVYCQGFVVSLLLLFWIDRTLAVGGEAEDTNRKKRALVKGLGGLLALLILLVYPAVAIHRRTTRDDNPERMQTLDISSLGLEVALVFLCMVYLLGVLPLAGWALSRGGAMKTIRASRRAQFFVLSSVVTAILLLPSIVMGYLQPTVAGGEAFTAVHGGVNLYVMALSLLCAPRYSGVAPKETNGVGLEDDDGDIAVADKTVNPMVHQRAVDAADAAEHQSASAGQGRGGGPGFWKGKKSAKARPKIHDSSLWEDGDGTWAEI